MWETKHGCCVYKAETLDKSRIVVIVDVFIVIRVGRAEHQRVFADLFGERPPRAVSCV